MTEEWRLLELKVDDPVETMNIEKAILNSESPTTLLFLLPPKLVWVGKTCVMEKNVNTEYCKEQGIPIVRSPVDPGRSVYYDGKDTNLWFYFIFTPSLIPSGDSSIVVADIINMALKKFYDVSIKYIDNDYRVGNRRIGMSSYSRGLHKMCVSGELILDVNLAETKKALLFPEEKWRKKPVNNIEKWFLPLRQLNPSITIQNLKESLRWGFESFFNANFVEGSLNPNERGLLDGYVGQKEKHISEEWIKYGRWSPVKDYRRH